MKVYQAKYNWMPAPAKVPLPGVSGIRGRARRSAVPAGLSVTKRL